MLAQAIAAITLGLLGTSGVAKVVDPVPTSGALRAARLPSSRWLAQALGLTEIAAAILGLALGGPVVWVSAILYGGFALFTVSAVVNRIPVQSCGCFGREDTPPSRIHVGFNLIAMASLGWVAATGSTAIPWDAPAVEVVLYVTFAAIGVYASYLLLSVLPQTLSLARTT